MVKARTCLALTLISFGTLAATVGCSGSDEVGNGGGLISAGNGGTSGASGAGKGGAVGRGGANASGGTGAQSSTVTSGSLGLACAADADCGAGLTCLLPTGTDFFGVGGPGNGLCTLSCATSADCSAAEPGAVCLDISGAGDGSKQICFESCMTGTPVGAATTKCQGRGDEVCVTLSDNTTTVCEPLCQSDAQCGTGFCGKQSGLCEKTKPKGDPVGTSCDPTATATSTCQAVCIQTSAANVKPVTGACAELCSGGTACMFTGTTPGGICAGLAQGSGLFDLGICEPLCACDKDCPIPGDLCQAWGTDTASQAVKTALGSDGFCFPNAIGSVELDCKGGAGGSAGTQAGGAGGTHTGGVGGVSSSGAAGTSANGGAGGGTAGTAGSSTAGTAGSSTAGTAGGGTAGTAGGGTGGV